MKRERKFLSLSHGAHSRKERERERERERKEEKSNKKGKGGRERESLSLSHWLLMNSIVYIFHRYCASILCNKIQFLSIVSARVESTGS